jgi:hypothetical protein
MKDVHIVGAFHASGGSGNDVQAVIARDIDFENWSNGHAARLLYDSGQATAGELDIPVQGSGNYHIAFSNKFSAISDKNIIGEIILRYRE